MNGPRYDHAFVPVGMHAVNPTPLPQNQSANLIVEGARQNNLKNISLRIPHNQGHGHYRRIRVREILAGLRHAVCRRPVALCGIALHLCPHVSRQGRVVPMSIGSSTSAPPLRSNRTTPSAPPARRSAPRPRLPTSCDSCSLKSGIRSAPIAPSMRAAFTLASSSTTSSTHCRNARAMILFPVTAPPPKQDQAFLQSLSQRGFTRVAVRRRVLDLHEIHTLPKTRPAHLHVILDRLVIREDNRSRLVEAIETAFREGEGLCRVEVIGPGLPYLQHKLSLSTMRTHVRTASSTPLFL